MFVVKSLDECWKRWLGPSSRAATRGALFFAVSACGSTRFSAEVSAGGSKPSDGQPSEPMTLDAAGLTTHGVALAPTSAEAGSSLSRPDAGPNSDYFPIDAGASDSAQLTTPTSGDFASSSSVGSSPALDTGDGYSTASGGYDLDASISGFEPDSSAVAGETTADDATEAFDPNACNAGEFEAPQLVRGLEFEDRLWGPAISTDGNVLLFGYTSSNEDLYMATLQPGQTRTFGDVTALTSLNTSDNEGTPFLSYDGSTLYFYAQRTGGPGDRDLWFATRSDAGGEFGEPQQVAGVNGELYDHLPWLSDDELTLYYTTEREGGLGKSDLWTARRPSKQAPFAEHALVPGINSEHREDAIAFSPDRLTVYFTTDRDTDGNLDIWQATRASRNAAFGNPEALDVLNSDAEDTNLALSRDGKRLYFSSGRDGRQRLWVAARTCE